MDVEYKQVNLSSSYNNGTTVVYPQCDTLKMCSTIWHSVYTLFKVTQSIAICDRISHNKASTHKIKLTFLPEMDCWSNTLSYSTLHFLQDWQVWFL